MNKNDILMPGGFEILFEAEKYLSIDKNHKCLSIGCANGELECYLAEKFGCKLWGIDLYEEFVKEAKEKAHKKGLDDKITFEVGDGSDIKYDDESFDFIFCSGAICAFFDNGINEFYRLLKPNGKVLISEVIFLKDEIPPQVYKYWGGNSKDKVMTVKNNCDAFENKGFKIIWCEEYNNEKWWYEYEDARIDNGCNWANEEKEKYKEHKEFIGIGAFVLEKIIRI